MLVLAGGVPRKSDEDTGNWSFVNCYGAFILKEGTSVAAFVVRVLLTSVVFGTYGK